MRSISVQIARTGQALLLAAWLCACGGGGGGASDLPPPAPPPDPGPVGSVRASAASLVAAGCTGGRTSGTLFAEAEVEPFVAISPTNPNHLIGTWQQDRASDGGARALVSAVSFDGGLSWARSLHPMSRCGGAIAGSVGDHERVSDPWVDIAADGTVFMMGLAFSGSILTDGSSSSMLVSRSTDGGRSWLPPVGLQRDGDQFFNDKNTLTADPTDARLVYTVWDRLDRNGNGPTLLARSGDAGASWEAARVIYTPRVDGGVGQTIGNRIVVLGDGPGRGTLVNVFVQIDTLPSGSTARVRVMRSTDKGLSWSAPITVADHRSIGTRDPDSSARVRDGAVVPSIATGADGVVWVAWQDARFSGGLRDAIALSRSSDGGLTWSAPVAVNRDPKVAAFTPTLQLRADGSLGLMHYDLRSNTAVASTLLADLWLLTSRDGNTWTETALARGFDLAVAPTVTGGLFLGDYHGLVAAGNSLVALVALPGNSSANPTDVYSIRIEPAAQARQPPLALGGQAAHPARAAAPVPGGLDEATFARARSDALRRAMEWRIPGWSRVVGARPLTE